MGRGGAADRDLDGCRRTAVLSRPRRGGLGVAGLAGGSRRAVVGRARAAAAGRAAAVSARTCQPVEAALSMLATAAHASDPTQGRAKASLVAEAALLLRSVARFTRRRPGGRRLDRRRFRPRLGLRRQGRRSDPRRAGADGRSRAQRLDLRGARHRIDRRLARRRGPVGAGDAAWPGAWRRDPAGSGAASTTPGATAPRPASSCMLARGDALPGFGHPLYPDIDPRAAALLEYRAAAGCRRRSGERSLRRDRPQAEHRSCGGRDGPGLRSSGRRAVPAVRRRAHGRLARPRNGAGRKRRAHPPARPLRRPAARNRRELCRSRG